MGCIRMINGCLPNGVVVGYCPSVGYSWNILGGRTYHEEHIGTQSTHDDMQQYDACYDMAIWMCLGLIQAITERIELIWIKDSIISLLNMALIVHFLILLKQQGKLVFSCMKPLQMDRLNFSDHFSYITYFNLSYSWTFAPFGSRIW